MFKRFNWEDAWLLLGYVTAILLVTCVGTCSMSKKYTKGYSLSGNSDGQLKIIKEIEWFEDDIIQLDRSVPYWDAIRMVDSLNAGLKKFPPKQR